MSKTKLLIFGSSSLVGSHFVEAFSDKYEISLAGRKNIFEGKDSLSSFRTLDIQRETDLKKVIRESDCECVLNYAGETNVDRCESEKSNKSGHVYVTNASAVGWMAEACKQEGKTFFHISTDFVFDGTNGPYSEDDLPGPLGAPIGLYGYTKYLAEKQVIDAIPDDHCILRISYPYRARYEFKTDF